MDWAAHVDTAVFGAVLCAAAGLLVPRIIERVPEPEPEEPDDAVERGGSGLSSESGEPGDTHASDAVQPAADRDTDRAQPRFEGGVQEEEVPKETYFAIADRPGLLWKSVLAAALAGAGIGLALGWDWALLVWLPLVPLGVALAVIDWRTRLLPTWLVTRTYVVVVLLVLVATLITRDWQDLVRAAIGWAAAGLLYFVLWFLYPRGLGYGDVRLSGIVGIALGYVGTAELVVGVYAGFLVGGLLGAVLAMLKIVDRKGVPFGPFMLVGAVIGLLASAWITALASG